MPREEQESLSSLLRKLHGINPQPPRDALGRREASPTEIERAMRGEYQLPQEEVLYKRPRRRRR